MRNNTKTLFTIAFGVGALGWLVFIILTRGMELWRGVYGLEWFLWITGGVVMSGLFCALLLLIANVLFPKDDE